MRQGCHGKAGVGDAQPGFFLGEQCCCGINRLAACFGFHHRSSALRSMAEDQIVD
jgi:hypothetical protein